MALLEFNDLKDIKEGTLLLVPSSRTFNGMSTLILIVRVYIDKYSNKMLSSIVVETYYNGRQHSSIESFDTRFLWVAYVADIDVIVVPPG